MMTSAETEQDRLRLHRGIEVVRKLDRAQDTIILDIGESGALMNLIRYQERRVQELETKIALMNLKANEARRNVIEDVANRFRLGAGRNSN